MCSVLALVTRDSCGAGNGSRERKKPNLLTRYLTRGPRWDVRTCPSPADSLPSLSWREIDFSLKKSGNGSGEQATCHDTHTPPARLSCACSGRTSLLSSWRTTHLSPAPSLFPSSAAPPTLTHLPLCLSVSHSFLHPACHLCKLEMRSKMPRLSLSVCISVSVSLLLE